MSNIFKAKDIANYFKGWKLDEESRKYIVYHSTRYQFLLEKISSLINSSIIKKRSENNIKILDIGPAYQTELLRQNFPNLIVDTLGFKDPRFINRKIDKHFEFDLNDAQYEQKWPKIGTYNIVIMAEVIEHLYTSPSLVLKCISTFMKKGDYLIIQTPNACSLSRRIKMLLGKNPYEMIRESRENPGHFREYTLSELISIGHQVGLKCFYADINNYFNSQSLQHKIYTSLTPIIPVSLREGITIIFKKS